VVEVGVGVVRESPQNITVAARSAAVRLVKERKLSTRTSKRSTRPAHPKSKANSPITRSTPSPTSSATECQPTGTCFYCLLPLTAMQPGGTDVRHLEGTPYGMCLPAIRSMALSNPETNLPFSG
jgi:hypothetical protein